MLDCRMPVECDRHGGLPFGRPEVARPPGLGWYVERCMHVGYNFVVDIRHDPRSIPFFGVHVDLVQCDAEGNIVDVCGEEAYTLDEAEWCWQTQIEDLLALS